MKKRLLVLLLVVALAVTVSMFTATATPQECLTALETFDPATADFCPACGATGVTWEEHSTGSIATAAAGGSKHVYLTANISSATNSTTYNVITNTTTGTLCVHLNGHSIGKANAALVVSNGTVNIMDAPNGGGRVYGNARQAYAAHQISGSAKINLYNTIVESISGTNSYKTGTTGIQAGGAGNGGAIIMTGTSEIAMYGNSVIRGGKAMNGGNVYLASGTKLTVNAGSKITGGAATTTSASSAGGNVFVAAGATLTLDGGEISGGDSNFTTPVSGKYPNGGNLYIAGTFVMKDGSVLNGTAYWEGGNILMSAATSDVDLLGGTISGGTATVGGNIGMNNGSLTLDGATVKNGSVKYGNTSWNCGPNLYQAAGTVTMTSGSLLIEDSHDATVTDKANDTAAGAYVYYGGNTNIAGGVFNMNGGAITGGKAAQGGGAVAIVKPDGSAGTGTFNLAGGTVSGGYSRYGGGNIEVHKTFNMTAGTVSDGDTATGTGAKQYGNDVMVVGASAVASITGGTVAGSVDMDAGYVNNSLTVGGTAQIGSLYLDDFNDGTNDLHHRITLGTFSDGANVKVLFVNYDEDTKKYVAAQNGTIGTIAETAVLRNEYIPYVHGQYVWGAALYKTDANELAICNTDAQIVAKDKAANADLNYGKLEQALAEVDAATEMIYLKNVDTATIDNTRTYASDIAINEDVVIDLNGVAVNGTFAVADGKTLTLVDVTADDDLVNGSTNSVKVTGNVATQTVHPKWGSTYVVLIDEETKVASVHSISMRVNKAYILESSKGMYYGVEYKLDPTLAAEVDQFGQFIYVNENAQYYTLETDFAGYYANGVAESTGVKITNIVSGTASDAENVATEIFAYGYISFNNGVTIKDTPVSYTMTEIMELAAEQGKTELKDFHDAYAATTGWNMDFTPAA